MTLQYTFKGNTELLATDCPYQKINKWSNPYWLLKVGSLSCTECKYNIRTDTDKKIVECGRE